MAGIEAHTKDGASVYPYGKKVDGRLSYMPTGEMILMIIDCERPKFASGSQHIGTLDEYRKAVEGVIAYFGRFEVDNERRCVHHFISQSVFPNWSNTPQVRQVELSGQDLYLRTGVHEWNGMSVITVAHWRRCKRFTEL